MNCQCTARSWLKGRRVPGELRGAARTPAVRRRCVVRDQHQVSTSVRSGATGCQTCRLAVRASKDRLRNNVNAGPGSAPHRSPRRSRHPSQRAPSVRRRHLRKTAPSPASSYRRVPAQAVSTDGFQRTAEGPVESTGERGEPLEERQRRRVKTGEHQAAMSGELRHAREAGLVRVAGASESCGRAVFTLGEGTFAAWTKIDEGF